MKKLNEKISEEASRHGSIPFWSWNDRLTDEGLRRQIRNMHDLGMRGFFMHARGGLETEYMSDEWFDAINSSVDEAKKLGMEAWAYDENGWPSGFGGGELLKDPRNFAKYLGLSESAEFPETDENTLAVYTVTGKTLNRVTSPCGAEKYYAVTRKSDFSYVDTMDGEITEKFIACTHEVYKKKVNPEDFGSTILRGRTPSSSILRRNTATTSETGFSTSSFRGLTAATLTDTTTALSATSSSSPAS